MEKLQNSVAENDAPRGVKVSISVIYALNFIFALCVFFLMGGAESVDDVVIPFGIFVALTAAQACVYHFLRTCTVHFTVQLVLSAVKFFVCFVCEFYWDYFNIFFGRADTIARSVFIIAYLAAIASAFVAEVVCLIIMRRSAKRSIPQGGRPA